MGDRFAEYVLTLLAQVGGGRGGPENELVRFGLGILLWGVLIFFGQKRRREEQSFHETLLAWGFALGLLREAIMFVVFSLVVWDRLPSAFLHPFFPPLDHALAMAAVCIVTAGFLRGALGARGGGPLFLAAGVGGAAGLYLATAFPWARHVAAFPAEAFGGTGYDWAFRLWTAAVLGWALVLLLRVRGGLRTLLMSAVACFFLDEILVVANLAAGNAHHDTLGPIRNGLHLAGIAILGWVYLRQLSGERDEAITDLQTVIQLTEDERRRTESILDAIGDAVSVQDLQYRIIYQNRVHRTLLGNHVGRICFHAYAGADAPCPGCPVALALADGEIHRLERPRVVEGVTLGYSEVIASCLRDAGGRIVAGIEVARDVTERAAAAEELRRAKGELERQNAELRKLDTIKDGLIRDVSHEFKTPVAKHAMQLEILKGILREHGLEQETARVFDVMTASIARQQRMIRNILDLARLEAGGRRYRLEPVRLDELAVEVLEDRAYAIEAHGIAVRPELPGIVIRSDREMLHCLLSNLVDNAIKYRAVNTEAKITISAVEENGEAVLRVADNGVGFAADHVDRAFERFWQASASAEGSGVGLTICRMIVEDLGGRIAIASPGTGQGTTVTVWFPRDTQLSFEHLPAYHEEAASR